MNRLLIVGAGGHGRCCLDIARSMHCFDTIAFLDDKNIGSSVNGCKIIDSISNMNKQFPLYENVVIAIGHNETRKKLSELAKNIGFNLINLVSPNSFISPFSSIGEGCVIFPFACIEANASIGNGCIIASNTTINHDAKIKDFVLVYSNTVIRPNTVIHDLVRIGSGCVVSFGTQIEEKSDIKDGLIIEG